MDWERWLHAYAATWHDSWEIVGALGSAAAAGVALWLASRERADRKLAEADRRAAEQDRDEARAAQHAAETREAQREREAQARKVIIWRSKHGLGENVLIHLDFANYSDLPITQCMLIVDRDDGSRLLTAVAVHVEPGGRTPEPIVLDRQVSDESPSRDRVYIEFEDAWGVRWRRTSAGELMEAPKNAGPAASDGPVTYFDMLRSP